ncbi:MAG: SusD/RagB family nutrient-binding outer membrane lipoprotein [Phaeodactylibacter sp.]|nr:SusD/RagB family nutrient-binding outer membrane lipoprotein [Phaeodactylibacter sp.]
MKMKSFKIILASLVFLSISCDKDFEEINKNPFSPTQADIGPLFNTVVASLRLGWNEQFYVHNETLYGITQLAAKTGVGFDNINIGIEEIWRDYYRGLVHIRELERRFNEMDVEEEALNNVRAQLKVLLAYKTFRLTDLFGDVPFFDAGKGFQSLDLSRPGFDSQEEIYKFLLEELRWVEENINAAPDPRTASGAKYVSFGDFDNLFNGGLWMWRKFANSLRLRHAMRMVEKDPAYAEPIIKEIIENDLPIIESGEEVGMHPGRQDWRNDGVNWSFREHNKLRMGATIWRYLSENNNTDGSGIYDPRANIFFEPNNANEWVAFPQVPDADTPPAGGIPYGEHRDNNYSIKGNANIYSPFNYYLIRDNVDIPEVILTAAEMGFIKAEAYFRGLGVAMDEGAAEAEYTVAVVNSIKFWQGIAAGSQMWANAPPVLSENEIFAKLNHPRLSIFTSENKLELIYAQRWLDAFRQPWEAFALSRRVGATPREGEMPEYYRLPYPPSEAENNPDNWAGQVARMGEDSEKVKVWWMN